MLSSLVGRSEALCGFSGTLRDSVCVYLGQTHVNLWVYGGTQLQFCFADCPSPSILRSQWHHVDRATNPENMSILAVNKEWASLRLDIACSVQLCLSLSLFISHTSTLLLTLAFTCSVHTYTNRQLSQLSFSVSESSCFVLFVKYPRRAGSLRTIQEFARLSLLALAVTWVQTFI